MTEHDAADVDAPSLIPSLPTIVWQRRWFLIVPLVLVTLAGFATALLMRPVYESVGTVLIESPQLPAGLVNSPVTDIIDQRIARTRERVLSRMDLIRLIRANDLYPREQKTMPLSRIVDKMRADTTLAAVSADIGGKSQGAQADTIAINIGFHYSDPAKTQIIAQQYVNRFMELDASTQSEQAVGAATFLGDQASSIQAQIAQIEGKINAIKSRNGLVLALGMQSTGDGAADAVRIDSEIAQLETQNTQLLHTPDTSGANSGVQAAEQALRAAEARFSDSHPDVIAAKAQLAAARRDAGSGGGFNASAAQIAANQRQIGALRGAKGMLLSQSASARSAQSQAPALAAQVDQLEKQADTLRDQYRDLGSKVQAAQVSARMQTEQKGERLVLADPPVVPDRPTKPNRPVIIAGALIAGGVIGLALIFIVELMLRPMRGTGAVTHALGEAPLVVIPDFRYKPSFIIRWFEARNRRKPAGA